MIVYVETNFPLSIATGRDPQANNLLLNTPESVQIVMPSICYMEALSALEADLKYRRRFNDELLLRLNDAERNLTSQHSRSLFLHLRQAFAENRALLEEVKEVLFAALNHLAIKAEMISLNTEMVQASLQQNLTVDLTDNLILNCIIYHARKHQREVKVLLSGNTKDFGKQEVQGTLQDVGVSEYFSNTQTFLNWLESQSSS